MNRRFAALVAASVVLAGLSPAGTKAAAPLRTSDSVTIVKPARSVTVTKHHPVVTFNVKVVGIKLSGMSLGKKAMRNEGHLQVYADRIPTDAYTRTDLGTTWLASLSAVTFSLQLAAPVLEWGRHRILIALAQNNDVLYRAKPASVTVIVK